MEALPPAFARIGDDTGLSAAMPDPPATPLQIFALFIIFFFPAIALVVVLVRVAGRLASVQFGWDDWLISIAMFLSIVETVISYFCEYTLLGAESVLESVSCLLTVPDSYQNQLHWYTHQRCTAA